MEELFNAIRTGEYRLIEKRELEKLIKQNSYSKCECGRCICIQNDELRSSCRIPTIVVEKIANDSEETYSESESDIEI